MDYAQMNKEELQKTLNKLKDELEEIEEESMFVMSQTGIHLPGATVKKYEAEKEALKVKIREIETLLAG